MIWFYAIIVTFIAIMSNGNELPALFCGFILGLGVASRIHIKVNQNEQPL